MWIVINGANNGEYTGTLDNKPLTKGCLEIGDEIKFNYKNVLEIYKDNEN